jgi:hypothetical protein
VDKGFRMKQSIHPSTDHCFYTGFEGKVPSYRIGKENLAEKMYAFVVDIDQVYSQEAMIKAIASIPADFRPAYVEHTLSKKWRLIFIFARPVCWGVTRQVNKIWTTFLELFAKKSQIANLFGEALDKASYQASQLYFNHGTFYKVSDHKIPSRVLMDMERTVLNEIGNKERIASGTLSDYDRAFKALGEKYPKFKEAWPREQFVVGGQGTSFWVEGSDSPMSAIVKTEGMLTFSDHALRRFESWDSLLGKGFVQQDHQERDEMIFSSFYFNDAENKYYKHKEHNDTWLSLNKGDTREELVSLGVRKTIEKGTGEPMAEADTFLMEVRNRNTVSGIGPFMFRRERRVVLKEDNSCWLNSYTAYNAVPPADEPQEWGARAFLSYCKHAYEAFRNEVRQVKQALIMLGPAQTGKTFLNQAVLGGLVGGHRPAVDYLTAKTRFSGNIFNCAHLTVDDGEMSTSPNAKRMFTERVKSLTSKSDLFTEEKFKTANRGEWFGTTGITGNMDDESFHGALPDLNMSISDKLLVLKMSDDVLNYTQSELEAILARELSAFARWLVDWEIPKWMQASGRYALHPYKNQDILHEFAQSSNEFLLMQALVRAISLWKCEADNVDKKRFSGNHIDTYQMFTSYGGTTVNMRDWPQQKFVRTLTSAAQQVRSGCTKEQSPWLSYNKSNAKWTVLLDALPKS